MTADQFPPPPKADSEAPEHPLRCTCGRLLDGGSRVGHDPLGEPRRMQVVPGAIVVCSYCQKILHFTKTGVLIPMSSFAFQRLPASERRTVRNMQRALAEIQEQRKRRS